MKNILVLLLTFSVSLFAERFYKSGDSYVIDKKEQMMWQDTRANLSVLKSQEGAIEYCEKLRLGGYDNWVLPSRDDYEHIIDMNRINEEMTIIRKFEYVLKDHYWTNENTWRNFGLWAYFVYFKSGTFYYENKTYPKYVRCVRSMKKEEKSLSGFVDMIKKRIMD
jgi:hypothetical protein